jgi:hypothetical protein
MCGRRDFSVKTIALTSFTGNWRTIIEQVQQSGGAVALELDGTICGFLLPTYEAAQLARHFAPPEQHAPDQIAPPLDVMKNYLELLRNDPTLVPVVDGQPLEFVTMMNSSYVDPEQIYQFRHPKTRHTYLYHASELQQAIGRTFSRVAFIPQHPKDVVEGKHEPG